ncbi:hypothetical protein [Afipia carboxidovorans]|uniref:hypothetical protein n=1 Tax=Afipia carboxidovorans TaxID=40137 RepID=UPI00308F2F6F|nr:hypothetical protein CRBSH125_21640 [Afipia carboxidovorans]
MVELIGPLIGTVVGGAISATVAFLLAKQNNRTIEARDAKQRKQLQKSALLKLQMRASILASDVASTMRAIDQMLNEANEAGRSGWPKHARIKPIVGNHEKVSFPIEEMEPLIEAKEFDIVQDLVELSMRHEAFVQAISTYSNLRLDLKNKVTITSVEGSVFGASLNDHELKQLKPYLVELEALIEHALSMGRSLETQAKATITKIGPAARKHLKDQSFPHLTWADDPHQDIIQESTKLL